MTQDSDDQSGAGAGTPPAPKTGGAAGAMALGSILTVAGILLLFVFFVFGVVALQYCINAWDREHQHGEQSRRRRRGSRGPRTGAGDGGSSRGVRRTSRGVDPELLRSLPVTVYHDGSDKDDAAVECAVCLTELQDGEEARFLPRCGHGFHAECVDMWLASHTTCPLCRLTVSKPDDVPSRPVSASLALPPVAPEPANYASANVPASVLLGVSGHGAMVTAAGAGSTAAMVIEIPEFAVPTPTLTPRDAASAKSPPGSARLRSIRRLWSFGKGAGPSSSSSCAGAGQGVDLEHCIR